MTYDMTKAVFGPGCLVAQARQRRTRKPFAVIAQASPPFLTLSKGAQFALVAG
jgi:hypothetical protein